MKLVRFWYVALVPPKAKGVCRGGFPKFKYERYPYHRDFPEGTTWADALQWIPNMDHKISKKTEKSDLFSVPKMMSIHPTHFEFVSEQVIDKP